MGCTVYSLFHKKVIRCPQLFMLCVCETVGFFYLVLVLLHHGELSLQLPQHLKLWRLQAGPVTPQLFQQLETDNSKNPGVKSRDHKYSKIWR